MDAACVSRLAVAVNLEAEKFHRVAESLNVGHPSGGVCLMVWAVWMGGGDDVVYGSCGVCGIA